MSTSLTNYYFKGGLYFFDDYSKLQVRRALSPRPSPHSLPHPPLTHTVQATLATNLGPGTVLGTYADNQCVTVNTVGTAGTVLGGGLPIMVTYLSNAAACVLNIATGTSLQSTCAGPADPAGTGDVVGALTGTVTQYSDTTCTAVSQAPLTYNTGSFCWSTAATGTANIVPTIGPYTGGFCQLTNDKVYGSAVGTNAATDEAVEGIELVTGYTTDCPKFRAAYIAAVQSVLPAGSTVSILGVTLTGASSRRLGQVSPI